jgi:glutamate dehydrogenase
MKPKELAASSATAATPTAPLVPAMANEPQDPQAMLVRLQQHLLGDLDACVRWYYAQMPTTYLQVTSRREQALHLEMVLMMRRAAESRLSVVDDAATGKLLVFGRPGLHSLGDVMTLIETRGAQTKGFSEKLIHRVELHTALDRSLFLYAFCYGIDEAPEGVDQAAHRQTILDACTDGAAPGAATAEAARYLDAVEPAYLARSRPERVVRHLRAWSRLAGDEDVAVACEAVPAQGEAPAETRLLIASGSLTPWPLLEHAARVIQRHGLALSRGYLDVAPARREGGPRTLIASFYVTGRTAEGSVRALTATDLDAVAADLGRAHRPYADVLAAKYLDGTYQLDQLELLRACVGAAAALIAPDFPYLDVAETGNEVVAAQPELCREICALISARFQPGATVDPASWQPRHDAALARAHALEPRSHAAVAEAVLAVAGAITLTNAWRPQRLGLAFALDPAVLPAARFPHRPYGLFWMYGPHARGFHVRFRASARGGLRVLIPRNAAQYERARDGMLKEVYDLAWAQQLKNKDIPEGGSKCIALVEPGGSPDAAVRQVADSLLDLIVPPATVPEVIGAYGAERKAALLFLGPDENMTPERISWVAARARDRGLPHHQTLMSSKPGSGINHKEFGVTSEGIFHWIAQVLPIVGITDGKPYTVKITGGPDGDVGGNLLKVLAREHRGRAKIVAVGDGTGSAHDPDGLDWNELLRLVEEAQGIAKFSPAKLSGPQARVVPAIDKASENIRNRLHNTVQADLFVPCGGRPYTINDDNWKDFLRPDGKPSARAMVEGANIFLTPSARTHLEDAGLVVIKDSSANKGGVICSSYEVLAGLVLSDAEFLAHKPRYVAEVLAIIGQRAIDEARALVSAWTRRGRQVRLSELSQQISEEINRVSGLLDTEISAHLDDPAMAATWKMHLHGHCPPLLVELHADRLARDIPRDHQVAILAKRLASRMVYREGLTWCRTYLTASRLWETVATYLAAERQMDELARQLSKLKLPGLDLPAGDNLVSVIAAGAQRELVRRRLGQA